MVDSKIKWTDRSDWNPIRGCTRVSPGCGGPGPHGGCYAEAMAGRFSDPRQWGHGFATRTKSGGRWTGKIEVQWDRIDLPLRWRIPAKIFASSTSDWFHEKLPMDEIATMYAVAVAAVHLRKHTIQILTKRADRMREIMNDQTFWDQVNAEASMHVMAATDPLDRRRGDARATLDDYGPQNPPPGIWLGVSVEDQQRADERIPALLGTPAAVRFLSCEPLLGPVDMSPFHIGWSRCPACGTAGDPSPDFPLGSERFCSECFGDFEVDGHHLHWVICGGESGPNARPMHPDWARSLRDQCVAAGVPFFFKQWGEWHPGSNTAEFNGYMLPREPRTFHDFVEGDPCNRMFLIGKKAAGAMLDGQEWRQFPDPRA